MFEFDDAFFNRNCAGARGGRWAGPGLLAGWGCRLLDRRGWGRTVATMLDCRIPGMALLCKNKEEGGGQGLRPWPLRFLS